MIQIRTGIFETNSSSVHTVVICSEEEFKKFNNDELCLNYRTDELVPYSEKDNSGKFFTAEEFFEDTDMDHYLEHFEEHKTVDGVDIVVFGRWGFDN